MVTVNAVDEDDTGVTVLPGVLGHFLEDRARPQASGGLASAGANEVILPVLLHSLHELLGDRDRDVEVGDGHHVFLAGDEVHDVRVGDR